MYQLLSQFNIERSLVIINSQEISASNDNLTAANGKDRKAGYIILYDIDSLIYHINNFEFIVQLVLKDDSQASLQINSASKKLTSG